MLTSSYACETKCAFLEGKVKEGEEEGEMKGYPGGHFGHVGMIVYSLVVDDQYNLIGGEQSRKNTERIGRKKRLDSRCIEEEAMLMFWFDCVKGTKERRSGESINTVVGNYNPKA